MTRTMVALGAVALLALPACNESADDPGIQIGLLLSYSGQVASTSVNSERALLLAVEMANQAGGVAGQVITLNTRDTHSDPRKVKLRAQELLNAGVPVFIGPDNNELAVELKTVLAEQTVIMPSFTTTEFTIYKPHPWFVMGAPSRRLACELMAQLRRDGRRKPIVIADAVGYNSQLAFEMTLNYQLPQLFLAKDQAGNEQTVRAITAANADAYVLAALPPAATFLLFTLAAVGTVGDPSRWYLSPTLHSPALLENIPKGMLQGAHGVANGAIAGAADFGKQFQARFQEKPLDDAYPFFDAGAIAILALQRAITIEGAIPQGTGLGKHIVAVTSAKGTPVLWNEIGRGLELLRQGTEVAYVGLNGVLEFDLTGQSRVANTVWWTIGPDGFMDVARTGDCR